MCLFGLLEREIEVVSRTKAPTWSGIKKAMPKYVSSSKGKSKRKKADLKSVSKAKRRLKQLRAAKSQHSVEDLLGKAEECLDLCQPELALGWCERAHQLEPSSVRVLEAMGPLLLDLGYTDRAMEVAVELSPEQGHSKYMYLGQMAEGEEAVGYLMQGIDIMTKALHAHSAVEGGVCGSMEGEVTAEDISTAYCTLAEVYLTDSCFTSNAEQHCYDCCTKAMELAPRNSEAYQLMASCLLSKNNPQEARTVLLKGVALWLPSCKQENKQEGRKEEGGASASAPSPAGADEEAAMPPYSSRINCAKLLLELGENDKAYEVLEGLLCEDDEVVAVWYLMGWLNYLTADRDSAQFYLEQTKKLFTKLECDDTEMLAHTRELLEELGEGRGDDGTGNELPLEGGEEDKLLPDVKEGDSEHQQDMETT